MKQKIIQKLNFLVPKHYIISITLMQTFHDYRNKKPISNVNSMCC